MPLILHAADIHLDSPLRGLERYEGAPVEALRNATRRALELLVDRAIDRKADLIVIAGDLYDGDGTDYATTLFLNVQMDRLHQAGIPVCVIRGNHDAMSVLTRHLRCPPNVHVFSSDRAETKPFDEIGVAVHGQSYATRAVSENLAVAYPEPIAGLFNIGVLHTCVVGREGHERYAPCSLDDLRARGYDYWALGHVHTPEVFSERPLIVMPGNLQGRHARECGSRGFVWVDVQPGAKPRHIDSPLEVVRWETVDVDASGLNSMDEVVEQSERALFVAAGRTEAELLAIRLRILGATAAHVRLAAEADRLVAELRGLTARIPGRLIWVEKVKVQTRDNRTRDCDSGPFGTLERVVEKLRTDDGELGQFVADAFADLRKKLPPGLLSSDAGPALSDRAWLTAVLERAHARLQAGLLEDEEGGP